MAPCPPDQRRGEPRFADHGAFPKGTPARGKRAPMVRLQMGGKAVLQSYGRTLR